MSIDSDFGALVASGQGDHDRSAALGYLIGLAPAVGSSAGSSAALGYLVGLANVVGSSAGVSSALGVGYAALLNWGPSKNLMVVPGEQHIMGGADRLGDYGARVGASRHGGSDRRGLRAGPSKRSADNCASERRVGDNPMNQRSAA